MSRYTQCPPMPCCCARSNRPGSRYAHRSETSDTDEYDYFKHSFPRSDYSGRSSQRYENSSVLDDQAWNALTSLRQKACRFITSEPEDTPPDPPAFHCPCTREFRSGGADLLRRANDLIDYTPQSEFLKRMKQQCQFLANNQPNIFSALDEGLVNDCYDSQLPNESPRMGEYGYNSEGPSRVRFNGMDPCDDEMLYQNSSYDPRCSADEKLLDHLVDKRLPSDQSLERPKSAKKKSEHISRSKKPVKCRGRRKRKSGSPEKCESEDQFEPTLKKPHENSCERCWRFASPARSPVNKPDQKYDPNFRRGHSCYDFERGDGEFYDRHVSPCKNLQPITSREKQELPPAATPSFTQRAPETRPLSSTGQRSPDRSRSLSSGRQRSPDVQPQSNCQKSQETQPQTFTSTWHKSPEAQPQTFTSNWPKSPEAQRQTYTSTCHRSPEAQPQMFTSTWHKSPEAQPQTYTSTWHKSPEAQPQTWQKSPEVQPRQVLQQRPMQFRGQSPTGAKENDYCYPSTRSDWARSPERNVFRPQSLDHSSQPNYPVSQGIIYSEPMQRPRPKSYIPGDFYSADVKRCSDGMDDLDITEYRSICMGPREQTYEPPNASLSTRPIGNTSQLCAGENTYSPRRNSPPRPGPASLGTIPEAADSDSSKSKTPKDSHKGTPKSVRVKSPKSPTRQGTRKADSTGRKNGSPSPAKRTKSPNKSAVGSSPNKSSKSPNRSGNGSAKKCEPKSTPSKPVSGKQEAKKSPKKSPQKSPKADVKKIKSLDEVKSKKPVTPEQRPQTSDPRVREMSYRKDQIQASARVEGPDQYLGLDHQIRGCTCGPDTSFPREMTSGRHTVCCHCDWDKQERSGYSPKPSRSTSPANSENKRLRPQTSAELNDRQLSENAARSSPRGSPPPESKSQTFKGFDGRTFECPHRKAANFSAEQPPGSTLNSSFERDCRLLSELQNTPSFQSSFQGMSPILPAPRKYFMFYMTKCKENKGGDDDVEVLVEELTQACPSKSDSRTKDLTEKMKKIMECPADSMALRFQKGVSDQCRLPQSSRVLYF